MTKEPEDTAKDISTNVEKALDSASENVATSAQTLKEGAARLAQQAGEKARDLVADGTTRAADALEEVSRMVNDAAATVDAKVGEQYGKYARGAADAIADFSGKLKGKSADDLMEDARGFVRKSPAVAIGIAAALGFVLARVVRSGMKSTNDNDNYNA